MFNNFFDHQRSIVRNNRELPATLTQNNASVSIINFSTDDIIKIIRNLDPNKSHRQDKISIAMIIIWNNSICRILKLIFYSCLESGKFLID